MRRRFAWVLVAAVAIALALPAIASAITMREGDVITVQRGETIADDLYAFGNTITIDGRVEGELVAFGQIVIVNGEVGGSVISGAQTVRIGGTVGGTVRAGAAMVDVSGRVGGDVLAGANQVSISGDVGRDLAAGSQSVDITGNVGRNVMVGSDSLTIAGRVGGNVEARANRVTVASQGTIAGDLDYWSSREADVQGQVAGTTTRHEPSDDQQRGAHRGGVAGAFLGVVLAWVQSLIGFAILGLLMVLLLHGTVDGGSYTVMSRLLPSLGIGLVAFFVTPPVAAFIFVVGLFVGIWWLAFVLLAVYWLVLLAGLVVGSIALGRTILRKTASRHEPALGWSLLLGLVLVWVVGTVPFFGWLAAWAVMLAGIGALVLLWIEGSKTPAASAEALTPEPMPPIQAPGAPEA